MPRGTLEVVLISAKGLEDNDFLSSIDPYVILTYRAQEHKSTVQEGAGSNPQWNETFLFTVSDTAYELNLKIMEKDNYSADDNLGEVIIPLETVIQEGSVPENSYKLVKDEKYCGEVKVALTFTPERNYERSYNQEEETGGWKQSARDF
ncbi:putative C2 domain-containing protein [Medicago truncatula]|uniref:Calcium-dependent lipid-binding (CaLB domain) family protein n=1 Tax=Medicago truncatula TaxID=3880 RepID=G7LCN5_MEDTR|nr:16 kDa phloem protein 2 [Medicago truncatula]AET02102.1 calcium-dependent lipid-binding (CaLB domain) family protein [Medicago truncatula]AFK37811.1 unknown [Medicago truncatula]RHN40002.1 putative C2 domain-containing protein [Medicago truncatula]